MENAKIYAAFVKAQSEFKELKKNATAQAGKFSYNYVTLDSLIDCVRPALNKNEIAVSQNINNNGENIEVITTLLHSSGEKIINTCPVVGVHMDMQKLGSAITYARRYGLQSICGVFAEEDDDGAMAKPTQNSRPQQAQQTQQNSQGGISQAQIKRLYALKSKAQVDNDTLNEFLKSKNINSLTDLSRAQYDLICNRFEQKANGNNYNTEDIPF